MKVKGLRYGELRSLGQRCVHLIVGVQLQGQCLQEREWASSLSGTLFLNETQLKVVDVESDTAVRNRKSLTEVHSRLFA